MKKRKPRSKKENWTRALLSFSPCSEKLRFYRKFKTIREAWAGIEDSSDVDWIAARFLPTEQYTKYAKLKYRLEDKVEKTAAYKKLNEKYDRHYDYMYEERCKGTTKKDKLTPKQVKAVLKAMDMMMVKAYKEAFYQVSKKRYPTKEMIASAIAFRNNY